MYRLIRQVADGLYRINNVISDVSRWRFSDELEASAKVLREREKSDLMLCALLENMAACLNI